MKAWPLIAASLLAAACTAVEAPPGFQLQCDEDCPDGTSCQNNCCVRPGEKPTCNTMPGFASDAESGIGQPCTGGCFQESGQCQGTCGRSQCYSEELYGLPGGACSWRTPENASSNNCPGGTRNVLGYDALCLQSCTWQNCRPGWRCECSDGDGYSNQTCGCVPDCASAPEVCGPGQTVGGKRCDASTGRCYVAAQCRPVGQACVQSSDCCEVENGHCCGELCAPGACQ